MSEISDSVQSSPMDVDSEFESEPVIFVSKIAKYLLERSVQINDAANDIEFKARSAYTDEESDAVKEEAIRLDGQGQLLEEIIIDLSNATISE